MKRAVSIVLLSIMLLVAAQPTIAFHYCGNRLQSVGIGNTDTPSSCCGKKDCCSSHTVQLTTDHFQLSQQESAVVPPSGNLHPVLFVCIDRLFNLENTNLLPLLQTLFPPGGLAKDVINRLAFICVFRI